MLYCPILFFQVCFDSLILAAKTTILDLFLGDFAGGIFISESVKKEALAKESADAKLIEKRIEQNRVKIKNSKNKNAVEKMMLDFNIGIGEAETIAVCLENNWQLVGTDDKNAIKACKVLEIAFATAIDILIMLNKKNILSKNEAFLKIEKLSEFGWYSDDIIEDAKNKLR